MQLVMIEEDEGGRIVSQMLVEEEMEKGNTEQSRNTKLTKITTLYARHSDQQLPACERALRPQASEAFR